MQPCQVCGEVLVDAAGYCVRCRNYRGQDAVPTAGYPTVPATAAPVTSSGYVAPSIAPPPVRQRTPFLIPLIASCAAVLVVAVGIIIVLVSKSGRPSNVAGSGGSTAPDPLRSPLIDPCLVGVWSTTSASQQFMVPSVGTIVLQLKAPDSQTVTIRPDGSATENFNHTQLEGALGGHTYTVEVNGTGAYTLRTANNTLTFLDPTSNGTITIAVDGTALTSAPLSLTNAPVNYTCEGNKVTEHNDGFDTRLTRQS
ncbi:MAG: hypothetical protein J2P15_09695 [Micromonosporaceae bacterium]|nr:hypothetical protein [Micromonosporaceae bacterium]